MDTELATQAAMVDWSHRWFSTTPGWLSVVFAIVIVLAVVALIHDWRQDRRDFGTAHRQPGEPRQNRINHGRS